MVVGGGAGEQVEVRAGELGDGRVLAPVAVGGVGPVDLGRVALEGRDPGGGALLGRPRGPSVVVEQLGRGRAGSRLGQAGAQRAEPGLLAQRERDLPLLLGQERAGGGLVEQVGPDDLGRVNGVDRVLSAAQQDPGAGVEVGFGEIAAAVRPRAR